MSTTLEEIEAAYIAAKQRVFHSGTRAIATPEQCQAWGQEFRDAIAQERAEAWDEGHEAAAMRVPEGVWHDVAAPHPGNPYRKEDQ